MQKLIESDQIPGVYLVKLRSISDERGHFAEIFRKEWFPQRSWDIVQSNRSESLSGVLRGLHYHHKQVDYWFLVRGRIRAALVDLRRSSPARYQSQIIEMAAEDNYGLFIPVGVAHGFFSLADSTLLYIVDNYYDGSDEYGIAWNDPDLGLDWGANQPRISERDNNNPRLRDISDSDLPA